MTKHDVIKRRGAVPAVRCPCCQTTMIFVFGEALPHRQTKLIYRCSPCATETKRIYSADSRSGHASSSTTSVPHRTGPDERAVKNSEDDSSDA
jgi:hypothetical protein